MMFLTLIQLVTLVVAELVIQVKIVKHGTDRQIYVTQVLVQTVELVL